MVSCIGYVVVDYSLGPSSKKGSRTEAGDRMATIVGDALAVPNATARDTCYLDDLDGLALITRGVDDEQGSRSLRQINT